MSDNNINQILKERRQQLQLTIKEVANAVGVSSSTVSRWESGNVSNMRRDRIAKLASILQISPNILIDEDNDNKQKKPKELMTLLEKEDYTLNGVIATPEDKEKLKRVIEAAFWDAKAKNKKK